jgi:hypothetical protein
MAAFGALLQMPPSRSFAEAYRDQLKRVEI